MTCGVCSTRKTIIKRDVQKLVDRYNSTFHRFRAFLDDKTAFEMNMTTGFANSGATCVLSCVVPGRTILNGKVHLEGGQEFENPVGRVRSWYRGCGGTTFIQNR